MKYWQSKKYGNIVYFMSSRWISVCHVQVRATVALVFLKVIVLGFNKAASPDFTNSVWQLLDADEIWFLYFYDSYKILLHCIFIIIKSLLRFSWFFCISLIVEDMCRGEKLIWYKLDKTSMTCVFQNLTFSKGTTLFALEYNDNHHI